MKSLTLENIHQDILDLKDELQEIKSYLKEDFELSEWAKKELKKARSETKVISHDKVMQKYT